MRNIRQSVGRVICQLDLQAPLGRSLTLRIASIKPLPHQVLIA